MTDPLPAGEARARRIGVKRRSSLPVQLNTDPLRGRDHVDEPLGERDFERVCGPKTRCMLVTIAPRFHSGADPWVVVPRRTAPNDEWTVV